MVHRVGYGLLPCPQQAFHSLACALVHDQVGVHERSIHVATKVDGVRGADILDDRIEHV